MSFLESIQSHADLVALNDDERMELCDEIRQFIVSHVAKTGGHLASNLGVVELSVAIETVFDTVSDRLVFDVGHQSYVHKLLTGRQADFDRLRMYGGLSGFPKPYESQTDAFVAGHASSSVSIALGMARARKLTGQDYNVVALIGDGAFTGGMAYEGMNDAGASGEPMVVILNDNEMSIDRNVGGMASYLSRIRTRPGYSDFKRKYRRMLEKIPGGKAVYHFTHQTKELVKRSLLPETIFQYMGFEYLGPVDGHDLPMLIRALRTARDKQRPVLVHVITHKGHGYRPAEEDPSRFHGIGKFNPADGSGLSEKKETFSDVFGETMVQLGSENPRVCAITAAMPGGTGLIGFKEAYPQRLYDVGIAEEHAVSMAGGLAKQGAIPVAAIYSTFFQRSYDQILQDVTLEQLHVVLAVDRAGLVGEDGPTHHGVFDVGFLSQMPGMTILCPASHLELQQMLRWAVLDCAGPVAVRYPRGSQGAYTESGFAGDPSGLCQHRQGGDATLICYGTICNEVLQAAELLAAQGIQVEVVRLLSANRYDAQVLARAVSSRQIVIVEEACTGSGRKERIAWDLAVQGVAAEVHGIDLGPDFVPHGDQASLYRRAGLDAQAIANYVQEVIQHEN